MTMRRQTRKRWPNGATVYNEADVLGVGANTANQSGEVLINWDAASDPAPAALGLSVHVRRAFSPDEAEQLAERIFAAVAAVRSDLSARLRYEAALRGEEVR